MPRESQTRLDPLQQSLSSAELSLAGLSDAMQSAPEAAALSRDAYLKTAREYLDSNESAVALPFLRKALQLQSEPGLLALAEELESKHLALAIVTNRILRTKILSLLQGLGYRAIAVVGGAEAAAILKQAPAKLVIIDEEIAGSSANRACRMIRKTGHRRFPVVVLSRRAGMFARAASWFSGANLVLEKPFKESDFEEGLRKIWVQS